MPARYQMSDPGVSRAVLAGTAHYDHGNLDDLPAVAANLDHLRMLLMEPDLWGLPEGNCTVLLDCDRVPIADALDSAARAAEDLLLVYYAGHGLCKEQDGALLLATPDVRQDRPWAARKVLLLDCCFSGRAIGGMSGSGADFADRAQVEGSYIMTSTAPTRTALAPPGAQFTAFTGELVSVLSQGIPGSGPVLECQLLYEHIRRQCASKSYPEPQQRTIQFGGQIPLVRNRAHRTARNVRTVSLEPLDFSVEVDLNRYLPIGASQARAVLTVTARSPGGQVPQAVLGRRGIVFLLGTAPSVEDPPVTLTEATRAVGTAIDMLPDGVRFAVIAGSDIATMVYPAGMLLATASRTTRAEGKAAASRISVRQGTAFGSWLRAAGELLRGADLGHAILLTDSVDRSETPAELRAALDACQGAFSCDGRGIGTSWEVGQLRRITVALTGTVDVVLSPSDLEAELQAIVESWMGKTMVNPILRIQTPDGARVTGLKQMAPVMEDMMHWLGPSSGQDTADCPLGVWGAESRDYHLIIDLPARRPGIEVLVAQASIVCPDASGHGEVGEVIAQALIRAEWTKAAEITPSPRLADYEGKLELAEVIAEGLAERRRAVP